MHLYDDRLTNHRSSGRSWRPVPCEVSWTEKINGLTESLSAFSKSSQLERNWRVQLTRRRWLWPVPLIVGIYFAPESPWWLVRKNRIEEAKASLIRLTSPDRIDFDVEKAIILMTVTTEREFEENASTSYLACFRGTALRRTLIAVLCYCVQITSGNGLRSYSTYFFTQAGLPTDQAFNMTIVGYGLGIAGVLIAVSIPLFRSRRS